MLKVGDAVMLGTWDELLGSELVLTAPAASDADMGGASAAWQTVAPASGGEATGASSTSTRRITFVPARQVGSHASAGDAGPAMADLLADVDEDEMPLAART